MGNDDRVQFAGLGPRILQAVDIFLLILEFQRIIGRLGQFDPLIEALVKQHLQPRLDLEAEMLAAMRTNIECGLKVAMKHHVAADRAAVPQIFRHFARGDQPLELGADEIGQPVHDGTLS